MKFEAWLRTLVFVWSLVAVAACRKGEATASAPLTGESCDIRSDVDGGALDVSGRPDGIYAIRSDGVAGSPLATIDHLVKTSEGVDPKSGKRRRQAALGPYIVDFFCEQARLVVEADGAHHFPPPPSDIVRDRFLRATGLTVLRIANHEILTQPDRALSRIRALLPTPLLPSGEGAGG